MKYSHKLPDESVNLPKENLFIFALKLLGGLAIIAIGVYFTISIAVNLIASNITPKQEKKMMEYVSFDMNLSGEENEYLTQIKDRLVKCTDLPYDIKIYKQSMSQPNAFAVPGGTIYVTQGMLDRLKSENELAFIIGHELGHFKNKDHIRGLGKSVILSVLAMFLGDNYGTVLSTTLQIGQARYSQSAELEADEFGLEVMQCAYGTVRKATNFFEKMDDGESWKFFLATHPAFGKRVEKMKSLIEKNGYNTDKAVIPLKKL